MATFLNNSKVLFVCAALFVFGTIAKSDAGANLAAPTSLSLMYQGEQASGPTIPPGPWDEEEGEGETKVASGPTIPPGPWDEEEGEGETKIA
jgi:hypothetical protein